MPDTASLIGKTFGRWKVIAISSPIVRPSGRLEPAVLCRCNCGGEKIVRVSSLINGDSKSCGCLLTESRIKHGMAHSKLYGVWEAMIARCTNPNNPRWSSYGGRGITVCEIWMKFDNFYADMGCPQAGMTLERKDNDKGYYKENCSWEPQRVQSRNKRSNRIVEVLGVRGCFVDVARHFGIHYMTASVRIKRGWGLEQAFTTPVNKR